jgi:hypothetical protein
MENLPDPSGNPDISHKGQPNSLMLIAESIGAYFGKIPIALQRNVTKALGHLLGVPIAYLDGLADEVKAASAARIKITEATGNKLAKSIEIDQELAQIAVATHASKILRHQKNRIQIAKFVAEDINTTTQNRIEPTLDSEEGKAETKEISDDWLNAFESEAVNMSSEQMQRLFGKMLAGEITKPSSYSVRTVKLMGQMDSDVAQMFQKFCSMCITIKARDNEIVDSRVITFEKNKSLGLYDFGLNFIEISTLAEYGLLVEPNASEMPYGMAIPDCGANVFTPVRYANNDYIFMPIPPRNASEFLRHGEMGLALSRAGKELLSIVDIQENEAYTNSLKSYLKKRGLSLLQV